MASLPSPTQVSGKHNAIYEAYYKQVDPKGLGTIEAMDAAKFLKKSGLSDVVLSRIWDLSDPKGRGCLDKAGFFVSLKLVALAQAGRDINIRNIFFESPNPPKVGELPKIIPQTIQSVPAGNTDWSMKPADKIKYEQLFESLQPVNGLIAGNKVKGVLMDSKLPLDTLGKIWDLADQDKDGSLDKHEFSVAMHLVYQALDKRAVPSSLPAELQRTKPVVPPPPVSTTTAPVSNDFDAGFVANFPTDIAPPPVPPLPAVMPARIPPSVPTMSLISTEPIAPIKPAAPSVDWVVTPQERMRFETMFRESDRDKDGLVSGLEVKNVFLQSGVPQNCLAHIWALCDTDQSGKLTLEQFALAMWMVERKRNGLEPPEVLTPNMIPPSLRGTSVPIETPGPIQPNPEPKPTYTNPELEMISKEIDELARERRILETDIAQKEADIRIKSGEVRSLQSELDTLAATLKQLENQKGEAQKRLDDLKSQYNEVTDALASVDVEIDTTREQVNKIRDQCQKQQDTINEQEGELNSKRSELQKLKDEETALEKEYESNHKELDKLTKQLQDTQLQISQVKAMVTQLLETQRQMNDALLLCKAAIEANDASLVSDYSLYIEPDLSEAKFTLQKQIEPSKSESEDHFASKDVFASDPFNKTNGFSSDPFSGTTNGIRTTFDDNFANAPISGFDDAFSGSANSGFGSAQTKDPFVSSASAADPFGDKKSTAVTPEPGKDDFGSDPFAILHAPTSASQILSPNSSQKSGPPPRPESPSPALPPKKSKQPPPRPAPPRPGQGPTRPAPPANDGSGSGFADFANFEKLQLPLPPPTTQPPTITHTQQSSAITQQSNSVVNKNTSTIITSTTTTVPPADFVDDPFKDYRYEDPFSIKDPFADDENENGSSEDIFADELNVPEKQPSQNPLSNGDSLFDKFADDFKTSTVPGNINNNISQKTNKGKKAENSVDNFANFDAFTSNDNKNANVDFFDAFNDNFKSANNKNSKINSTSVFDAFGDMKITSLNDNKMAISSMKTITSMTTESKTNKTKLFDDFNDNFADDFFKSDITSNFGLTTDISKSNENILRKSHDNFAKFDAFGDDDFDDNFNKRNQLNSVDDVKRKHSELPSIPKEEKVAEKFVSDYSKTDNFEIDLEAVLKRSLVEQ